MLVQPVHAGDTRDAGEDGVGASNLPGPTIQDGGANSVSLHSCTGIALFSRLLRFAVVERTEHSNKALYSLLLCSHILGENS